MCDYSLEHLASRPASVGDKIVSTKFHNTVTKGFADKAVPDVAVCMLPGTEIAFERNIVVEKFCHISREVPFSVAVFAEIDKEMPFRHHDALEFPNGERVLVSDLQPGQAATVLQLPAKELPAMVEQPGSMAGITEYSVTETVTSLRDMTITGGTTIPAGKPLLVEMD